MSKTKKFWNYRKASTQQSKMLIIAVAAIIVIVGIYYLTLPKTEPTPTPTPTPTEPEEEIIIVFGTTDVIFGVIDPAQDQSTLGMICNFNVFDPLYKPKTGIFPDFEYEPALASGEPTISDDGLTWYIPLREDVTFHDGTKFNASAMKFSLDRAIEMDSYPAWYIDIIDGVDVVDDYTIEIHLKYAYSGFKGQLMQAVASPVSPTAVQTMSEEEFSRKPVGAGPFKYVEWVRGERIVMERFDDYWNKEAIPKVDKIVYKIYSDMSTLKLALQKGEVDIVAMGPTAVDIKEIMGMSGINYEVYSRMELHWLTLNVNITESPFYDIHVREAVFHCIDQEEISEKIWRGVYSPVYDSVFLPGLMMKPSWRPYTEKVDIPKAKQLLEDAGYPDGVDITLSYCVGMYGDETDDLAVLIQNQLAKAGIRVHFNKMEMGAFYERWRAGEFEFAMGLMFPDWIDPDSVASFIAQTGASYTKRVQLSDPKIDALIAAGKSEIDPVKRERIYGEIQDLLADHMCYLPMVGKSDYIFYREGITGVEGYYFAQAPWHLISTK